ncbi:LysE family translocator [Lacibacterium aquatile]|uniref:LysE family translocator n=1 Tax=Lacibacterium aquatile TaxID=1168082 RepID=A0ABW5DV11_9PROT
MTANLIAFAGVIALASASPGPNVILVVDHSLAVGLKRIAPTILGNISFLFLIALAAALGVGALIKAAPVAFDALRLAGAAYLAYLGIKALRAAFSGQAALSGGAGASDAALTRYRQAFLMSATNIQSILFLSALFPQFIDHGEPLTGQFLLLFSTLILVVGSVHLSYALCAAVVRRHLGDGRFRAGIKALSGIAFIGFSAAILTSVLRRG